MLHANYNDLSVGLYSHFQDCCQGPRVQKYKTVSIECCIQDPIRIVSGQDNVKGSIFSQDKYFAGRQDFDIFIGILTTAEALSDPSTCPEYHVEIARGCKGRR